MGIKPKKRVLVVEDEPSWQRLIGDLVQEVATELDCTIEVVIATRFAEASNKIAAMPYDCVTIDNKLPDGMMAKPLLDRVTELDHRVPVVVISGVVAPGDVRDFFKDYKIDEFFWKDDFNPRQFKQTFTRLLVLVSATRVLDSILGFFGAAGFEVRDVTGTGCTLVPQDPRNRRRLGPLVYVHVEPEQVVRREDIEAVVETTRAHYDNEISNRTAFIALERPPDYGARYQMHTYRFSDHFVIVPFSVPQLCQALQTDSCPALLDEVLGAYLGETDLYDSHSPVSDVLSFFGRERILDTIRRVLDSDDHVGLFGFRKMGKTSLLNYLRDQAPYPIAVLSLQDVREPVHIYRTAVEEWIKALQLQFPETSSSGLLLMRSDLPCDPETTFKSDVQTLLNLLASHNVPQRLVLCLDEIDEIVPSDDSSDESIAAFRSLMGFLRGIATRFKALNLIVCGMNPPVNRANRWQGQSNPVFQSFHEVFLGPFRKEENDEMVRSIGAHMGVEYDSAALEHLYLETAGHPYITRQMCSLAVAKATRRPYGFTTYGFTKADIASAADEYLRNPKTIVYLEQELWGTLQSQAEVTILKALASHQPQTEIELTPEDLSNTERIARQAALGSLSERYLIREAGDNGYCIPYDCFCRWIRMSFLGTF